VKTWQGGSVVRRKHEGVAAQKHNSIEVASEVEMWRRHVEVWQCEER